MTESVAHNTVLLTTNDLANILQIPASTIRGWRRTGTGPVGLKLGRHVRYTREAVDVWIAQHAARAMEFDA